MFSFWFFWFFFPVYFYFLFFPPRVRHEKLGAAFSAKRDSSSGSRSAATRREERKNAASAGGFSISLAGLNYSVSDTVVVLLSTGPGAFGRKYSKSRRSVVRSYGGLSFDLWRTDPCVFDAVDIKSRLRRPATAASITREDPPSDLVSRVFFPRPPRPHVAKSVATAARRSSADRENAPTFPRGVKSDSVTFGPHGNDSYVFDGVFEGKIDLNGTRCFHDAIQGCASIRVIRISQHNDH